MQRPLVGTNSLVPSAMFVIHNSSRSIPGRLRLYATNWPSGESVAFLAIASSSVSGFPEPRRRATGSRGNTHRRVDPSSVVNASRVPSRDTAADTSGPGPVVSRSADTHWRLFGSTRIFQRL